MESFRVHFVLGLIALSLGHVSGAVDTSTIFFRHYRGQTHTDINIRQITTLIGQINLNENTIFHIHGYTESVERESVILIMNAYLQHTTYNVIAIDYRQLADNINYFTDVNHVDKVGAAIADALSQLVAHGLNPNKIHVIGHSLGGQVAGHVGAHSTFPIPRITGLDPAGPMFYTGRYLKSGDAQFVDIIHTDRGFLGQLYSSADADFHPNDGHRPQPGCPIIPHQDHTETNCNHRRSWRYYAESVANPNGFMAVQCSGSSQFKSGKCNRANVVRMGFAVPHTARGKFYLHTNARSPYAKGMQGI